MTIFEYLVVVPELVAREKRRPKSGRLQKRLLRLMLSMNMCSKFRMIRCQAENSWRDVANFAVDSRSDAWSFPRVYR